MKTLSIKDIENKLQNISENSDPFLQQLIADDRKGVQQLLTKWNKRHERKRQEEEKFFQMSAYERQARQAGYEFIAGIDEVGRGPLAGPVVAACVILPKSFYLLGIDDSKKLTEEKREEYFRIIQEQASAIGIGLIDVEEIDSINIYEATKKAMLLSIQNLSLQPEYILVDAMKLETPYPTESIIKGDGKSISIAAASIVAKVTRDRLMKKIHNDYPQYHFCTNMGYGTKEHLLAIDKYGVTPYHRKSFEPIKSLMK